MNDYLIFTDIQISKAKKVHVVSSENSKTHTWHPTIAGALHELYDAGVQETFIVDDDKCFHVRFEPAPFTGVEPTLTGTEGK